MISEISYSHSVKPRLYSASHFPVLVGEPFSEIVPALWRDISGDSNHGNYCSF